MSKSIDVQFLLFYRRLAEIKLTNHNGLHWKCLRRYIIFTSLKRDSFICRRALIEALIECSLSGPRHDKGCRKRRDARNQTCQRHGRDQQSEPTPADHNADRYLADRIAGDCR
jgi:hypothetical protein